MGDLTVPGVAAPALRVAQAEPQRSAGFRFLSPLDAQRDPPAPAPERPLLSLSPAAPAVPLDTPPASGVPVQGPKTLIRLRAAGPDLPNVNPGRGFYRDLSGDATLTPSSPAQVRSLDQTLLRAHDDGRRLVFSTVNIAPFRDQPLDPAVIQRLDTGLARVRAHGMQAILRFSYNTPASETDYRGAPDAPGNRILEHIRQLTPVLQRNADTIFALQAGFSGAWGEWHSSTSGNDTPQWRSDIAGALLQAYPGDVQFRYPSHVMELARAGVTDRVGLHNDCFMSSPTDVGTYSENAAERERQKAFVAQRSATTIYGGETCNPADDPQPRPRLSCEAVLQEGRENNLTYLGDDYYAAFRNAWRANGCYREVENHMGYRVRLDQVSIPAVARPGTAVAVGLEVTNDGMAPVHVNNGIALYLRNTVTGQRVQVPMSADIALRRWTRGETRTTARAVLPTDLPVGTWAVGIGFPPSSARMSHPSQSIRPANADDRPRGQFWDDGVFFIGHTLQVAG